MLGLNLQRDDIQDKMFFTVANDRGAIHAPSRSVRDYVDCWPATVARKTFPNRGPSRALISRIACTWAAGNRLSSLDPGQKDSRYRRKRCRGFPDRDAPAASPSAAKTAAVEEPLQPAATRSILTPRGQTSTCCHYRSTGFSDSFQLFASAARWRLLRRNSYSKTVRRVPVRTRPRFHREALQ